MTVREMKKFLDGLGEEALDAEILLDDGDRSFVVDRAEWDEGEPAIPSEELEEVPAHVMVWLNEIP